MKRLITTLLLLASTSLLLAQEKVLSTMQITDTTGKEYKVTGIEEGLKIEGFEDQILFLEFFGHKCPPCLASIPHLIELQKKHGDKIAVIAVEVQGYTKESLATFAKSQGINYITVSAYQAGRLIDYIEQRAQWQGGIPFLIVFDPKGHVQVIQSGMLQSSRLEEIVTKISSTPKK
jgi:thiol-disulfide isomerase/thioredoxin